MEGEHGVRFLVDDVVASKEEMVVFGDVGLLRLGDEQTSQKFLDRAQKDGRIQTGAPNILFIVYGRKIGMIAREEDEVLSITLLENGPLASFLRTTFRTREM